MKLFISTFIIVFLLISTNLIAAEKANEDKTKALTITNVWAKPNFGKNGAAYFTLKNNSKVKRHLIGASSPLSDRVELHTHLHEDGVMKMRQLKDGIIIAPGETISFKPAGNHVMLMGMKEKLKEGATYPLKLLFKDESEEALKVTIKWKVKNKNPDMRGSHNDEHRGSH